MLVGVEVVPSAAAIVNRVVQVAVVGSPVFVLRGQRLMYLLKIGSETYNWRK